MEISQAAQLAHELGRGMTRKSDASKVVIFPNNGYYGCLIAVQGNKPEQDEVVPRWQPNLDDLIADDWYALGSFK